MAPERLSPVARVQLFADFVLIRQTRRAHPAESGSLSYGPTVRFRLLSTPPRGDAVTFSFVGLVPHGADFHRADGAPSRAHRIRCAHPGYKNAAAAASGFVRRPDDHEVRVTRAPSSRIPGRCAALLPGYEKTRRSREGVGGKVVATGGLEPPTSAL